MLGKPDKTRSRWRIAGLIGLMWRADRRVFLVLMAFTLVLGVLPNVIVLATGWFIDSVAAAVRHGLFDAEGRTALLALVTVSGCFALRGALMAIVRWVTEVANSRFAGRFAVELGEALLAPRSLEVLEEPRLADQVDGLRELETSGAYLQAVPATRMLISRRIGGIGSAVILFALAWWAPIVIAAGWSVARWGSSRWARRGFDAARAEGAGRLRRSEYLRGFATSAASSKEVRVFGLRVWLLGQYTSTWHSAMRRVWEARRTSSRDLVLGIGGLVGAHAAVFGALGWSAFRGDIGAGAAVTFGMAVLGTADLGYLGDQEWRLARAAELVRQLRLVRDQLHRAELPTTPPHPPIDLPGQGARLDLRGVRFTYRGASAAVLDGLDLHVPSGQSLAIVGENGAGKSTLLKLLCGLYQADDGDIEMDGLDVVTMNSSDFARRVGIIFQDFLRYELSLRENVEFGALGLRGRSGELDRAMYDAGADQIVEQLPNGWETIVSAGYRGGVDLSGGQWQRVALARALLSVRAGARLLILDEPTASLDIRSEIELFERFLDVSQGVTTILVSHRLSGVRRADRIVVLADGRICEDGTHEELMDLDGRYASMFRLQAERFAATPPEGPHQSMAVSGSDEG